MSQRACRGGVQLAQVSRLCRWGETKAESLEARAEGGLWASRMMALDSSASMVRKSAGFSLNVAFINFPLTVVGWLSECNYPVRSSTSLILEREDKGGWCSFEIALLSEGCLRIGSFGWLIGDVNQL